MWAGMEARRDGREHVSSDRSLIHVHIDAKCGLEGDESGMGQRTAENRRKATMSLPGNTRGTNV